MNKLTLMIGLLIGLLAFQTIAEAASISTRVRILESKVYKQGKQIDRQIRENKYQNAKLDKGLAEIKTLKGQVEEFMRDAKKKEEHEADNRYSFP
ncbi:MAG: hypothetical protein R3219_07145 [Hydrogenovibrio sp.]|nr:hypothetical protein [Hydrogenovibrio sp.]